MAYIQQLSQAILIPLEQKRLNITQWKAIKPLDNSIEIYINDSVFFIDGINVQILNEINAENKPAKFKYEFISSTLKCMKCNGTGIIDWVDKVTKVKENVNYSISTKRYIRDKKGQISILTSDHGDHILTSVPKKKLGEEYCSECYGCGIKFLPWIKKVDAMYFDKC